MPGLDGDLDSKFKPKHLDENPATVQHLPAQFLATKAQQVVAGRSHPVIASGWHLQESQKQNL